MDYQQRIKKCQGKCKERLIVAGMNFYWLPSKKGFDDTCIQCRGGKPRGKRVTEKNYLKIKEENEREENTTIT